MKKTTMSRRELLATSAVLPLIAAGSVRVSVAADMPEVDEGSDLARTYGYVKASAKDGQTCDNCVLWQGGDKPLGGCPLFPNASVDAKGWCRSWVKRG